MNLLLETQRLLLEPVGENELDLLHSILTDAYVRRYLCDDEILGVETVQEMLDKSQRLFATEKAGIWLIRTKETRETIGFTCLWYFFGENQPQLGYALLPKATKKGFGSEAASRIMAYAFEELKYKYLVASCDRPNIESQKLAARIGMKMVEERLIDGKPTVFFRIDQK